jgi:hypothetical protein
MGRGLPLARGAREIEAVERVLARARGGLLTLPGVVGVGIGRRAGRAVIVVMVDPAHGDAGNLPAAIDGCPVVVEKTGPIIAY